MQKIGDITDTADGNGEFTDGNVAGNVMPTELMAAWFTTMQREIIAVLTEAKIQPDKADDAQLLAAIKIILTKGIDGSGFLLAKNNFSDVEDNALSRGHLGLKSAAVQDVVISMTDSTAGRVPIVGWMGLGGNSIPVTTASNADLTKMPGIPFNAIREYKSSDGSVYLIGISGISPSGNLVEWLAPENGSDGKKIAVRNKDSLFILYSTANKPTAADVGAIPFYGQIPAGKNLNTLTNYGVWFNPANANATLALNYPSTQAGSLQVIQDAGTAQIYTEYSGGKQYRRGLYDGRWSAWRVVYDSLNKPNSDDVNAISRDTCHVAGFVNGNKTLPYMRHTTSNEVIQLVPIGTADARYIQNTQMGAEEYVDIPYPGQASIPWGACPTAFVGTTKSTGSGISYHISRVYFRRLQKYIGGAWKNVA